MIESSGVLGHLEVRGNIPTKEIIEIVGSGGTLPCKVMSSGHFSDSLFNDKNQSIAWYACEASLGKKRYVRLNEWKTRGSVC